ncbi:Hypp2256 [Branchiostoma lanceolatum]|uniref:Hypp2256 protein n=1 Tax=Branchiostoma lanceolatum TaxID=7740 RepID=A0A8J9ZS37_BRALA|nr:Hypp2256 [Branchiostoma lanceolatum]
MEDGVVHYVGRKVLLARCPLDDPSRKARVNGAVLSDSKQVTLPARVTGGAGGLGGSRGLEGLCGREFYSELK